MTLALIGIIPPSYHHLGFHYTAEYFLLSYITAVVQRLSYTLYGERSTGCTMAAVHMIRRPPHNPLLSQNDEPKKRKQFDLSKKTSFQKAIINISIPLRVYSHILYRPINSYR